MAKEAGMLVRTTIKELISSKNAGMRIPEANLELVIHPDQQNGQITALTVYKHLKEEGHIVNCLSQRDGEEIQGLDCHTFRKVFGKDATLLLWRTSKFCEDPIPKVPMISVIREPGTSRESVKIRHVEMFRLIGRYHFTPRIFRG